MASTYSNHFIVCGLGNVGYRVVGYLQKMGKDIVVIERSPDSSFVKEIRDRGITVLIGDARSNELLAQVGAGKAQAVLAVTNDDMANLEIVLDARQLNPDVRAVLRMFNDSLAVKVQKAFNIQVAFSASALAGPAFAAASASTSVRQSFHVQDDIYHVAEFGVASGLASKNVAEVESIFPCAVLAVIHGGQQHVFPPPGRKLERGDTLIAAAALETIARMEREC